MLAGEPGIGKTRTAQELALMPRATMRRCCGAIATRKPARRPTGHGCRSSARALRAADPRALLADVGTGASDIADIVPEIRDLLPELEPSVRLEDAAQARFRMFEFDPAAARQPVRRRRPRCWCWTICTGPTRRRCACSNSSRPSWPSSRLLLVGTYRPTELSRQHPLSDALGALARAPHVARVNLAGLSAEEVQDFIAAATGTTAAGVAGQHRSTRQTEGNPLFLREIVRFLEQQGVLGADRATPLAALPAAIRIPEGVREVIGRRLNLLSAACNEVLALAAVIGRDFA